MRLTLPPELPITEHADTIIAALKQHQVLIVCGDTGSGKTTQLPKLVAKAFPNARGMIGITQPRRLAAIAMARRLAEEVGSPLGATVGYQHRFEAKLSPSTRFKFMTDGILLAETRHDAHFKRYSTLIIDEAHERSLNIDFLLGLIKQLLPKRPDLHVIIASATLDAARFSTFFNEAPVISIPGRLYPIETVWLEEEEVEEDDLPRLVANAVDKAGTDSGDILVFLPGERDIRETMTFLQGRNLPRTELLPLLASLPAGEQARVFQSSPLRRIILATNVAETSVTIPGIRVVIDSGLARIKRYSAQRHIQTLRIEPISQASARQRMGRCGRVGPGICFRLYTETDYQRREAHTAPEIKRTALAGVILTMADLRLGHIEDFPFLEPPTGVAIREGYRELLELGALTRDTSKEHNDWKLTPIGRTLATFPVEPRFARILIAAEAECALRDALTVVAAMACDEPLLRPIDKAEQADQQHARFRCKNSDFKSRLWLWDWWNDTSQGTSETQRRKRCKTAFISYPKMREWANIRAQLEELCREKRLHINDTKGGEVGLHKALLCGLLSRIGHYDREAKDYRGAFAVRFALFPGSGLAKAAKRERPEDARNKPKKIDPYALPDSRDWVLAGELVETSRLFGRTVACIDPRWIEPIAGPLCKVHRHDAFWDADKGFVRVHEDVTLFGLPITSGRLRDLSRLDPEAARRFFIADALCVPDAIHHAPKWLQENWRKQRLLEQLTALQRNNRDSLREHLIAFYEQHLPKDICNVPQFSRKCPPLPLKGEAFSIDAATLNDFPETITVGGETFPLSYCHAPHTVDDGVSIIASPENLHFLAHWHSEWLVPGLLAEKVMWMLNAQPARVRHTLGNLQDLHSLLLAKMRPYTRPLAETLYRLIREERGIRVDESVWEEDRLPPHLRMNFKVFQGEKCLGQGRNLTPLLELFASQKHAPTPKAETLADPALARIANHKECIEALKKLGGNRWSNYAQFPSLPQPVKGFLKEADIDVARMGQEMLVKVIEETFLHAPDDPQNATELQARYSACKSHIANIAAEWRRRIVYILSETARLEHAVQTTTGIYPDTTEDLLDQLAWLVFDGFVATVPAEMLASYPQILKGIEERLQRARNNPSGDRKKMESYLPLWKRYLDFTAQTKKPRHNPILLNQYRWSVEAFRLTTFCPGSSSFIKTSVKQLDQLWTDMLNA